MKNSLGLFSIAVLAVGLVGLGGCGKGSGTHLPDEGREGQQGSDPESPAFVDEEVLKSLSLARARCYDRSQCSDSTGALFVALADRVQLCTAFLVAPDLVMTASHCIPEELKKQDDLCELRMELVFPETRRTLSERSSCARVESASPLESRDLFIQADYAFVRLKTPVVRKVFPVSSRGLFEGEKYFIEKASSVRGEHFPMGEIKREITRAVYSSWALPQANRPESPVMVFAGAHGGVELFEGSSGSPIIDNDGSVRAVTQAPLQTVPSAILDRMIDKPESLFYATNLACVNKLSASCRADLSNRTTQAARASLVQRAGEAGAERELSKKLAEWQDRRFSGLDWKLVLSNMLENESGQRRIVTPMPKCFLNPETHRDWLKRRPFGSSKGYNKRVTLAVDFPLWDIQVGFNSALQADHRVTALAPVSGTLTFFPRALAEAGESGVFLDPKLFEQSGKLILTFCP